MITNAYRAAIDGYLKKPLPDYTPAPWVAEETKKVSYREYCTGFYFGDPTEDANVSYAGGYVRTWDVAGVVTDADSEYLTLELLERGKAPVQFTVTEMQKADGEPIEAAPHPMMSLRIRSTLCPEAGALLRKQAQ